jgi:hypothetical protein
MPSGSASPEHVASAAGGTVGDHTPGQGTGLQRGRESRHTRASTKSRRDTSAAGNARIRVSTPAEPPSLTPNAARALLRILLGAARRRGVTPPDTDHYYDE